ncbi:MAG: amino acid synthesis family protein [Hyphomicrobiales bacterium]
MDIRKVVTFKERILGEGGKASAEPVTRAAGAAVFVNPFAGRFEDDLSRLFDAGAELGELLMGELLPLIPNPVVSYGKAALVGVNCDLENGHALLHPKLGKPMRDPIGGGEALIPSAAKVAAAGATLDVPLGHKDNAWSFDHFDAMTICVPDAPRADELVMVVALADGGRPVPRCGQGRILD